MYTSKPQLSFFHNEYLNFFDKVMYVMSCVLLLWIKKTPWYYCDNTQYQTLITTNTHCIHVYRVYYIST